MPADLVKVKELFLAVLELPATERAAYLEAACAGDAALRQQIETMLQSHEDSGELLMRPPEEMLADGGLTQGEATASLASAPPITRSEGTQAEHDSLDFLTPSAKPGHLGRLGHYEVQEVLGKGGFGIVLKAFDERLHRVVAIKVLSPAYAANGSARKRFIREARAAAAVKNEHVVGIYDVQEDANPPYLVMECIDGVSLQEKIDKHGPLGVTEILRIGMQIAEGLAAAHRQGKIHRDIKPANILLENGVERVKITDFGLARAVDDASLTQSGTIAGTPMYMSPEQAEGLPIDHRSDLFSLGTVMYAMCSGRPPFRASGSVAVLKRVVEETPRPIREINHEIPEWLCDIISRLHAKKPAERFVSAAEVAELLGQYLAHVQQPELAPRPKPASVSRQHEPIEAASKRRVLARQIAVGVPILAGIFVILYVVGLLWFREREPIFLVTSDDPGMRVTVARRDNGVETDVSADGYFRLPPGKYDVAIRCGPSRKLDSVLLSEWEQARTFPKERSEDQFALELKGDQRVTLIVKTSAVAAKAPAPAPGWVQLFNGKDLGGWKIHPSAPGDWKVEDNYLVGRGPKASYLFTERRDFANFHLRVEAKINAGGDSGIFLRAPFELKDSGVDGKNAWPHPLPESLEVQITDDGGPGAKSGLTGSLISLLQPAESHVKVDAWFTLELVAVDHHFVVKIDGKTVVDVTDDKKRTSRGHLALQVWEPTTVVHFRKIEIKELPSTGELKPKTTPPVPLPGMPDQVLPALAGAWKGEFRQKIYGGKPTEKKFNAVAVNDWIVGKKWLRQRVHMEDGGFLSLVSFEPGSRTFRDWNFHASGKLFGPSAGRWDQATRAMTLTNLPEEGILLLTTWRFIDADTVTWEILIRDKEGRTLFEMAGHLKRTTEDVAIDETTAAGPLPAGMAVLDRLVGDWQSTGVIKDAKNPAGLKAAWQSTARRILGGRVIAEQQTGPARDQEAYALSTFDSYGKAYGRWLFQADGTAQAYGGGWDEKTQTMKWHWSGRDGSLSSTTWQWRDATRRDWQILTKDASGKTTLEIQATGIR
jgi:serine/threonine protein kinase